MNTSKPSVNSVFQDVDKDLFVMYDVEIQMTGRLAGSIPGEPVDLAEMVRRRWAQATGKAKGEIVKEEFLGQLRHYLEEIGQDVSSMTDEDLLRMSEQKAVGARNIFRRDENGLWFAAHSIKAALKEAVNVLFAKEAWGKTRKGPMNFLAERVFVEPDRLRLIRRGHILAEADGVETLHGKVSGPLGPRSIVTQHEFIEQASLEFQLRVLRAANDEELVQRWPVIFRYLEENGIGSHRRLSEYGRFKTVKFDSAEGTVVPLRPKKAELEKGKPVMRAASIRKG